MKIITLNEDMIREFRIDIPHIIISIRSPETEKPSIPFSKSNEGILFLAFHDLDHMPEGKGIVLGASKPYILFDEDMAKKIWGFVEKFKDKVQLIVVNCEAGISRSAGVAAALSKALNGDDDDFFAKYLPNRLVYRALLKHIGESNGN